ncbi:MAG: hypothetical protein V2I74_13320 [Erythrobacter sp.]|jgi:protein TonB|nr:hypothetical protein [Erythrobacter sp.]
MFGFRSIPSSGPPGYSPRDSASERSAALILSLALTAGLLSLMLLISHPRHKPDRLAESLVVLTARQISATAPDPPEEENIDEPEVFAKSPEEAAPQSRPLTIAPPPALPVIPVAPIKLAPVVLPAIPRTGDGPLITPGAESRGDQAHGPAGIAGAGGNGVSGNGSGGAGNGKGRGSQLIASWAPGMDFTKNYRVYPAAAREAKIEGAAYLKCFVLRYDRVRDCSLAAEQPKGHGFGEAALKTERWLRIRVHNQAGRRMYNQWVVVKTYFVLPPDEQGEGEGDGPPSAAEVEAVP